MTTNTATAELTVEETILGKISDLREKLLTNHPQMPLLLHEIHRTLKENPACVTLLPEDAIVCIVQGLEKQTNTYLAHTLTKSSSAKTKSLKNVKSSDLGFDD